ncbi:mechanosensitive ion channel protein MscS [Lacihabitans sp. LS3-19]|nr:mechanosensitive ion channel protein MscS [Lacihabitans sp. LS3-19]
MNEFLNYQIIQIGKTTILVSTLFTLLICIFVFIVVLKILKKSIYSVKTIDPAKKYSIYNLLKYLLILISFGVTMQILGFNLSVLVAGSAALLVGLGLGIQDLFSDYISGIIILFDSTVKVGDVIEINGVICTVQEINLRTTTILTRDDKYIILPNTDLTRNNLINWTHNDVVSRFAVNVGVDYSSDVNVVMGILEKAAIEHQHILKTPKPFVRFEEFEDSSLKFTVLFWTNEVFRVENIKSDLRIEIFKQFNAKNVTIPFPQRVVHINK